MKTVTIHVPASSANLGPGFDTLGIAVNLLNSFELIQNDSETVLDENCGIDPALHEPCEKMIQYAARYFFEKTGLPETHFTLKVDNNVPIARGLASSATFRIAVVAGLNAMLAAEISDRKLVTIVSELEACTDNAAASFYGGMTASGIVNGKLYCYKCEIPNTLDFVAVWPSQAVETDKARVVFADTIPREDAVFNVNHAALLALAFAKGDYESMGDLFEDRLHQIDRQAKIPALKPLFDVIHAAREAGAIGGYLSGSGSTMMAVTQRNRESIGEAMREVFTSYGMESEVRFLKAYNLGTVINCE